MSIIVWLARSKADHLDFGLLDEAAYQVYLQVIREGLWNRYKVERTGKVYEFSSLKEFFEHKDGAGISNFDLFLRAVKSIATSGDPVLAPLAQELLGEIRPLIDERVREIQSKVEAGTTQAQVAAEHGISQPRVSQVISPGTYSPDRKRGARVDLSAGTDPVLAAARIRERLGDAFADALKLAL